MPPSTLGWPPSVRAAARFCVDLVWSAVRDLWRAPAGPRPASGAPLPRGPGAEGLRRSGRCLGPSLAGGAVFAIPAPPPCGWSGRPLAVVGRSAAAALSPFVSWTSSGRSVDRPETRGPRRGVPRTRGPGRNCGGHGLAFGSTGLYWAMSAAMSSRSCRGARSKGWSGSGPSGGGHATACRVLCRSRKHAVSRARLWLAGSSTFGPGTPGRPCESQ